jgi:serine/threonine-protein phosphatase PGAM5
VCVARQEDELRKLTPLGIEQSHRTGERIAEMMRGADPCNITSVRVSAMTRARETAEIIASHLDSIALAEPNPSFNEGRPCHTIPGGPTTKKIIDVTDDNHRRIEGAFRELFVRADEPADDDTEQHEFEIVVCHANVIRYWLCRYVVLFL